MSTPEPQPPASALIDGAERIVSVFGYWPSFHDAEIEKIELCTDRSLGRPTIRVWVHLFEMTREVDARGYFVLRHHMRASLVFRGTTPTKIEEFGNQNSIFELSIRDMRAEQLEGLRLRVTFEMACSPDVCFDCASVEVEEVLLDPRHPHHPFGGTTGAPEPPPAAD